MPRLIPLLLLFVAFSPAAQAQEFGRAEQMSSNAAAYYYFYEQGQSTVQVSVIGAVRLPGLYEIATGTDVRRLLMLAGGPTLDTRDARRERTVTVQLLRAGEERPVFERPLSEAVTGAAPQLIEGDALLVEVVDRERFNWRDTFTILGGLSAVAFMVQAVASLSD